jgi:hypothetical protein
MTDAAIGHTKSNFWQPGHLMGRMTDNNCREYETFSLQERHARNPVRAAGSTSDAAQTAAIRPATRPAATINVMKSINGIQPDVSKLSGIKVLYWHGKLRSRSLEKRSLFFKRLRMADIVAGECCGDRELSEFAPEFTSTSVKSLYLPLCRRINLK